MCLASCASSSFSANKAARHIGYLTTWMKPQNYSRIARLLLRLRANKLWQGDGRIEAAYNKDVVHSFDICVAENYKVTEFVGKTHKKKHL